MEPKISTGLLRKNPVRAKEDPLDYLLRHHHLLFNHKLFSSINYFSCIVMLIITIITSLNSISNEGFGNFLKDNAFGISATLFILLNMALEYFISFNIENHKKLELYWDIESASLSTRHKIHKELREQYRIYLAVTIINFSCAFVNFILENFTDIHILSDTIFIENILTGYQKTKIILKFIISLTHFCALLTAISQFLFIKYVSGTIKIQVHLLIDYFNRLEIYKSQDQEIGAHLEICCIHHIFIAGFNRGVIEIGAIPILLLPYGAILSALGCALLIYYSNSINTTLGLLLFSILVVFVIIESSRSGQDIQDAFEEFYMEMTKVAWCDWSERNKKSLLLMMTRCQKDEVFGALTVEINKSLLIKIMKTVYQAFLVIEQLLK